jgi:hypothetical protein
VQNDRMMEDFGDLARGWWEADRLAGGNRDERKRWELGEPRELAAAVQQAHDVVRDGGEAAISLVTALLGLARDTTAVAAVGVGPLEDLIVAHGDALSYRLEELARQSDSFRSALSSVWLEPGDLGPDAARRLERWIPGHAGGLVVSGDV